MGDFERRSAEAHAYHAFCMKKVRATPAPEAQKYPPGARVRIADDLGPSMRHFPSGLLATVVYTYAHAYGGNDVRSYCLSVDGIGEVSWYREGQLTPLPTDGSEGR